MIAYLDRSHTTHTSVATAADTDEHGETDISKLSNEEIGKRLENSLTSLWSITFQENYANYKKARIEPQYSIERLDDFGQQWNIRIQVAPVLRSPFREGLSRAR
ncbi:MAG: hypothetical protein GWP63_21850 [Haliea sp.]|nr:hypothetical protein [Haliea sp.]